MEGGEISQEVEKIKVRRVANLAIVSRKTGKLLLHKRVKEKYQGVDYWSFYGGRCDKGESPLNTVKREVYEELGIIFHSRDIAHILRSEREKISEKGKEIIQRDVYLAFSDEEEDSPFISREKQGEDGTFFEFDDALNLNFRNDIREEILAIDDVIQKFARHLGFLLESGLSIK